jgi:hypothetical protein
MNYEAIFNGLKLKSDSYFISKIDVSSPKTTVNKYELVRADGQIVTNQNYNERIIKIDGNIKANDLDDMLVKLDTLKQNLVGIDKNLDVYIGTQQRRYTATVNSFNYTTSGYFCEFSIEFTANAFGKEFNSTALTFGTYTSSPTTYTNTIQGNYHALPYLRFKFTSVIPYLNSAYLQIYNANTNQRMRITRTWGFEDTLIIDGENKSVSVYPTTQTTIDTMDSTTGWTADTGETLSNDSVNRLQGNSSIKNQMSTTKAYTFVQRIGSSTSIDLSHNSGYVVVPIYIPNPASGTVNKVRFQFGSRADYVTDYAYLDVTQQYDGTAIQYSEWNYFKFDMSTAPTITGSPNRTAIISIQIVLYFATTGKINGWNTDCITLNKPSITAITQDYEGTFPDLNIGSNSLVISDEFTRRSTTITGSYYKRYI